LSVHFFDYRTHSTNVMDRFRNVQLTFMCWRFLHLNVPAKVKHLWRCVVAAARRLVGGCDMIKLLLAGTTAFGLMTCAAMAQMATSQTTITAAPTVVAPPMGTMSTTTNRKSIGPDGSQSDSTSTTYRNSNGVASDSVTRSTTTAAPPPPVASTTTHNTMTTTNTD
jgi:hypothetical protein